VNNVDYDKLTDEERIELLRKEQDDNKRAFIIRSFSSDELKLEYIHLVQEDENKSCVTYRMTDEENKVKIIDMMQDEKWITAAIVEMSSNEYKIRYLSKIKNGEYKNRILRSIRENDNDIENYIKNIENEKDKALVVTRLTDDNVKMKYLDEIHDELNKALIVMTIENDELKLEYINKIKENTARTYLIASLRNKELRENMLQDKKRQYSNLSVPSGMTVGMEIECEGDNSVDSYFIGDIFEGWEAKHDNSLENGVEITTPIMSNSENDVHNLYLVCDILQSLEQSVSERCGGHVHIGADYLKTKEAYANLIELWSNNEELFYILSNNKGEIVREGAVEYATPFSKRIHNAIIDNRFKDFEGLSKEEFLKKVKYVQDYERGVDGRRTGINFLTAENLNTIEFRLSNGTVDANTWIENTNLFGGLVAISQRISDIQHKDIHEITAEDKSILEKYTRLKGRELSNEDRLDLLLDLCVPAEYKQIYIDRYIENSQLLEQNTELKDKLEGFISTKPIDFYVRGVATQQTYSSVKADEAVLVSDFLEFENPTQSQDKSVSLDD